MPSVDIANYPGTVEAFGGNAQRATVFLDRYALKDKEGKPVEDQPAQMWTRVATALGRDTGEQAEFFRILHDFKFVPGGRILAGAGTDSEVTFYNCYVIPVETKARRLGRGTVLGAEGDKGADSREAIFDTIGLMVDIMSRGGGVGINWSVLRPKGAYLKSVNGTSSGPVGWMDVASKAVGEVEQGGSRRGAAMFMLDDWHPDIEEFIDAKRDLTRITNANVSVCVSDAFMHAVEHDTVWVLGFPDTNHPAYNDEWDGDLLGWYERHGPGSIVEYREVRARDLWRKMAEAAWDNGEPGVVFLDRYNKVSTGAGVERIISVNPCGEQGLGPYSVCNLGAMNLDRYVVPSPTPKGAEYGQPFIFDWPSFSRDVRVATRFADRVIDVNYYFLPQNEDIQKRLRRIGLGVMGLADALVRLGLRYGSPEAVEFTETVFRVMKDAAIEESYNLAKEFGPAPAWDESMVDRPYIREYLDRTSALDAEEEIRKHGLRNIFLLTQAPTGTTSILAGVNSGIEPFFALGYWRKDRTGEHYVQPAALEGLNTGNEVDGDIYPPYVVTAAQVTVEEHIAMQAAAQRFVDSSISKTINAPNSHTIEDVEKAYTMAYQSGLKGIAYFRDGCGRAQVLYTDKTPEKSALEAENEALREQLDRVLGDLLDMAMPFERPEVLTGKTARVHTEVGTAYVTVNFTETGRPVEMFVAVGKAGTDIMELGEAIGRLGSLALQGYASLHDVAKQLEGIGGTSRFSSTLPDAIGRALREMADAQRAEPKKKPRPVADHQDERPEPKPLSARMSQKQSGQLCPDCQNFSVVLEEGCKKCHLCGWSAC